MEGGSAAPDQVTRESFVDPYAGRDRRQRLPSAYSSSSRQYALSADDARQRAVMPNRYDDGPQHYRNVGKMHYDDGVPFRSTGESYGARSDEIKLEAIPIHGGSANSPAKSQVPMRAVTLVTRHPRRMQVPQNATVGDLRRLLGEAVHPEYANPHTTIMHQNHVVHDDHLIADTNRLTGKAKSSDNVPVFDFYPPPGTNLHDIVPRDGNVTDILSTMGRGSFADSMEIKVGYPHVIEGARYPASMRDINSVTRELGGRMFEATNTALFKPSDSVPGNKALSYHLGVSDSFGRIHTRMDHRTHGKYGFVETLDNITGGENGSNADSAIIHLIPH